MYTERIGADVEGKPLTITRTYVPATVYDNKALLTADPEYVARLAAQPERLRQAMLEGRWDIKGGGEFFDMFDETKHVIRPAILEGDWYRFYGMDWGDRKPWAIVKCAVDKDGRVVVYGERYGQGTVDGIEKDNIGDHKTAAEVAKMAADDMAAEGVTEMVADYSCWNNGGVGVSVADFFMNEGITLVKCRKHTNNGRRSWSLLHELMREEDSCGRPYLRIFSTCKYLIREMENIQCDKNNIEDVDTKQSDTH